MSRVRSPQEKKRLSYARDHYSHGKTDKGWRKLKPRKKRKTERAFRKTVNDLTRVVTDDDGASNAQRRLLSARKDKVHDWGVVHLQENVTQKKRARARRVGGKKRRVASRLKAASKSK